RGPSRAAHQRHLPNRQAAASRFRRDRSCRLRQPRLRGDQETSDRQGRAAPRQPGAEQHALADLPPRSQQRGDRAEFRNQERDCVSCGMNNSEDVMAKYLLVSFKTCPWVQRAAIVLREKNIDFEFRHIDRDNRPDWFLAISPHKKVPVLRIDDKVSLFESNAINEYLDETIAPRLHPEDPVQRAINRAWTDFLPTFSEMVTGQAYADDEAEYKADIAKIPQ